MWPTPEYPGCPYCGSYNLAQCACGKVFCNSGESSHKTCPWCGQTGEYHKVDKINIQGGSL
ncbi:MAG: hypothetical protein LBF62_09490 [Tannerellaceae bacterium]|nr:hypothetical protein [Tannerellaceae bacterium]